MDGPEFRRRLQLNRQDYDELLRHLEETQASARMDRADQRSRPRLEYAVADIGLSIEHRHGGSANFLVCGRNISNGGISVLHGGYIHTGTSCRVILDKMTGQKMVVAGEVRYCRLVSGSCHEIGIRFTEEIDPELLRGAGDNPIEASPPAPEVKTVRRKLSGRILLADAFLPDLVLLRYQLGLYGPEILLATTPGALLDTMKREKIDIVASGLSIVGEDGVRTIRLVRELGFDGPLLVLTAETDSAALARAQRAGASEIVPKPYNFDLLIAQLDARLGSGEVPKPQHSTAFHQPGMPSLISRYVSMARDLAEEIKTTYNGGNWPQLEAICGQLKGSGCSYGFQNVTTTAIAALTELREDRASDCARIAVARLIECCRALEVCEETGEAA